MKLMFKKPIKRATVKRKTRTVKNIATAAVRDYVFTRERGICRCCGYLAAKSMHEIKPKSLGGIVSNTNSIAVCGDGVSGCHGRLQRHEILIRNKNADKFLAFRGLFLSSDVERGSEPGSGRITCEEIV